MKELVIKNARIVDPFKKGIVTSDIRILDGIISEIGDGIAGENTFDSSGNFVSPGWVDLQAGFRDPGYEYKEDIHSGLEAAAYGGFTGVLLGPETDPIIATKAIIDYVKSRSKGYATSIYPTAAVSREKGKDELSELHDLAMAGAMAFTTGHDGITDKGFLLRAMIYASDVSKPFFIMPFNRDVAGKGQMHEGYVNVRLGLKGIPAVSEIIEVKSIIDLAIYSGVPVHLSSISCFDSLQLISKARENGVNITASVTANHLYFTDEDLADFDTNLKLRPPLRSEYDRDSLRRSVLEYDYMSVCSDHDPQESDRKHCEFELAANGAIGLQTVYPILNGFTGADLEQIVNLLAVKPRKVLNIPVPKIAVGEKANLTIFNPDEEWTLNELTNKSKSRNTAFWGKKLKGRATAIINNAIIKNLD